MTLRQAMETMGKSGAVHARSDIALTRQVARLQAEYLDADPSLPMKGRLEPALGLDGTLDARPVGIMLELARGTALNVTDAVSFFGRHWSVLKYIGLFARDAGSGLMSLEQTVLRQVGPNQRRVISEELGIGFAAFAAKQWCRRRHPGIGPISVIDVDRTLLNGGIRTLQTNGKRQPDYLISFDDPNGSGTRQFELLESKGTVSIAKAVGQLGRAVTQLAGLTINGKMMTGLAVATVSTASGITILAVDPEEDPVTWAPSVNVLNKWRNHEPRWNGEESVIDVDREELAATATNVDLASLSQFAGASRATKEWLPRLKAQELPESEMETRRGSDGVNFVGQELSLQAGPERIRIFQGVSSDVLGGLRDLDALAVLQAQRALPTLRDDIEDALRVEVGAEKHSAVATSSDGSVLQITVD
jgi:hypothetical protein